MRQGVTTRTALVCILLGMSSLHATAQDTAHVSPREEAVARERTAAIRLMMANVEAPGAAPGAVIAAPSKQHPDYYRSWVRDAAITMREVVRLYLTEKNPTTKARYYQALVNYVAFSRRIQQTPNRSGGPGNLGLGEPLFNIDGSPFAKPWSRPQDDGPATRAVTMMMFANALLQEGKGDFVKEQLYSSQMPNTTAIKVDLEYVANHWHQTCFDLWEEEKGHHFYTELMQRRALLEGAKLAYQLEDPTAADRYREQAHALEAALDQHWDRSRQYLVSTVGRDGGVDYKTSNLDSSVVLAVLDGQGEEEFYPLTHGRILATVAAVEATFMALYPINQRPDIPGEGIGRYPEDRYDGRSTDALGNPWFFLTEAMGEFYFEMAYRLERSGLISVTPVKMGFLRRLGLPEGTFIAHTTLHQGEPVFSQLLTALRQKGDRYLNRVLFHKGADGSLSEQFNRDHGYMESAPRLTISFAQYLRLLRTREK